MEDQVAPHTPRPDRMEGFPSWLALLIGVVALGAGTQLLVGGGRLGVEIGVLLLIVALAFVAVALAQGAYGPAAEGPLDLSGRLGLGFLGGLLGVVAVRFLIWLTARSGLLALLGLRLGSWEVALVLGIGTGAAIFWGLVFGVLYPFVPGDSFVGKGVLVGLVASLYLLLKILPLDLGAGWFGVQIGPLTFLPVMLYGVVWGLVCAATIGWGAGGDQAPVSRYLRQPRAAQPGS